MSLEGILALTIGLLALPALVGLWFIYTVLIRPLKAPADRSNRLAKVRLFWEVLHNEHHFVECAPYLKKDVGEWNRD